MVAILVGLYLSAVPTATALAVVTVVAVYAQYLALVCSDDEGIHVAHLLTATIIQVAALRCRTLELQCYAGVY